MSDARPFETEALEEWREHPVTRQVLALLQEGADVNRAALASQLWLAGECDKEMLGRAKAQGELIEDLKEASADDFNGWAEFFRDQANGIQDTGGAKGD